MYKNVVQLHKKYTNVVDLHDTYVVPHTKENVVDLRNPNIPETKFNEKIATLHEKKFVRQEEKKNYFSFIYKITAVVTLVAMNSFALSSIGSTFSIFNDIEESNGNEHIAGVIDFSLELSPFSNDAWQNLIEGTSTAQDVDVLPNPVTNPFFYYASSTNFVGDPLFCAAIHVIATTDQGVQYDGSLYEMLTPTTTDISVWNLEFSNDEKFFNSVCQFDIDFNGWQTRHDYPEYHDGFSDTERTTHVLYSDGLKINKVYFEAPKNDCRHDVSSHFLTDDDPRLDRGERGDRQDRRMKWPHPSRDCYDGRTTDDPLPGYDSWPNSTSSATTSLPHYEWVEIYNDNNESVSIDGWFLCDGQECDVLSQSEEIPPGGFAIVVSDYSDLAGWITPDDFVIILVDDDEIGDGLDNENDVLFLRRPDFFTFDQVNWGIPDPLWPYYVPELWNPGVASTTPGTMIARVPTGFDTNQVTDWTVLYIPTVDLLYPGEVVNVQWLWDFVYLVSWEAFNPNGLDSELLIDIYMVQDTNYSGFYDAGDEHTLLVEKTENDGIEEVVMPNGFVGNFWIKIIATGPENPMTHSFDLSWPIEAAIPQYMLEDEDEQESILEAVFREMLATGESDYAYMLPQPEATTTASTTDETGTTTPEIIIDDFGTTTPTTTEPIATSSEPVATSTEEIVEEDEEERRERQERQEREEDEVATTTEAIIEEEEEIEDEE